MYVESEQEHLNRLREISRMAMEDDNLKVLRGRVLIPSSGYTINGTHIHEWRKALERRMGITGHIKTRLQPHVKGEITWLKESLCYSRANYQALRIGLATTPKDGKLVPIPLHQLVKEAEEYESFQNESHAREIARIYRRIEVQNHQTRGLLYAHIPCSEERSTRGYVPFWEKHGTLVLSPAIRAEPVGPGKAEVQVTVLSGETVIDTFITSARPQVSNPTAREERFYCSDGSVVYLRPPNLRQYLALIDKATYNPSSSKYYTVETGNISSLRKALTGTGKVAASKNEHHILGNVLIEIREDKLSITGTDNHTLIRSHQIPIQGYENDEELLVPGPFAVAVGEKTVDGEPISIGVGPDSLRVIQGELDIATPLAKGIYPNIEKLIAYRWRKTTSLGPAPALRNAIRKTKNHVEPYALRKIHLVPQEGIWVLTVHKGGRNGEDYVVPLPDSKASDDDEIVALSRDHLMQVAQMTQEHVVMHYMPSTLPLSFNVPEWDTCLVSPMLVTIGGEAQ